MRLFTDRRYRFPVLPDALWSAITRTDDYPRWWPWLTAFEADGLVAGGGVALCGASAAAVHGAVRDPPRGDSTSNLNWANETFAYADAHDGNTWVGVEKGNGTPSLAVSSYTPRRASPRSRVPMDPQRMSPMNRPRSRTRLETGPLIAPNRGRPRH